MSRKYLDIYEKACATVMNRFGLSTESAAVNFALRALASEPLSVEEAKRMRGLGWTSHFDSITVSPSFRNFLTFRVI